MVIVKIKNKTYSQDEIIKELKRCAVVSPAYSSISTVKPPLILKKANIIKQHDR